MSFNKFLTRLGVFVLLILMIMPIHAQSNLSIERLEQRVEANPSNAVARTMLIQAYLLDTRDIESAKALTEKMPKQEAEVYQWALTNPVNLKPAQLLRVADLYRDIVPKQSGERAKVANIRAYTYYGLFGQNPTDSGIDRSRAMIAREIFLKALREMNVGQEEIRKQQEQWTAAVVGKPAEREPEPEPNEPEPKQTPEKVEPEAETTDKNQPVVKETVGTDAAEKDVELPKIELEFPATALSRIGDATQRKRMLELASIKPEDISLEDLKMLSRNFFNLHQNGPTNYKKVFAVRALIYSKAIIEVMQGKNEMFVLQANIRTDKTTQYLDGQGGADQLSSALISKLKPMPGREPVVEQDPVKDPVQTVQQPKNNDPTPEPVASNGKQPIAKLNRFNNSLQMQMLRIKPGRFRRGASLTSVINRKDETPHDVILTRPYFMSKTEVTQKQYESLMGVNPSAVKGPDLPVTNVSWDDAVAFTKALSQKEGRRYRLPTEAEWEFACRAGTGTTYAIGGDVLPKEGMAVSFTGEPALTEPMPVNRLKANGWGLVAMHGNVWEWCLDGYGAYPTVTVRNPKAFPKGPRYVLRGGSFRRSEDDARSARRAQALQTAKFNHVGFRVVCEVR